MNQSFLKPSHNKENHTHSQYSFSNINEYLASEEKNFPDYFKQIKEACNLLGIWDKKKKIVIVVPVHSTEPDISPLLNDLNHQTISPFLFELNLFLNRRTDEPLFDHLNKQIQQFLGLHPDFPIKVLEKTFNRKITAGYMRKYIIDALLIRSNNPDLIIVNNDADIEYIDPQYLEEIFTVFEKFGHKITYRFSDPPEWIGKFPIFHKLTTFYRHIEEAWNTLEEDAFPIRVHNYNVCFTADIYAKNGGYEPTAYLAEDVVFSARATHRFGRHSFHHTSSRLCNSYRRWVPKYIRGTPLFAAYDDYWDSDVRMQDKNKLLQTLVETEKTRTLDYFLHEIRLYSYHFINRRIPWYLRPDITLLLSPNNKIENEKNISPWKTTAKIFKIALSRMEMEEVYYSIFS